MWHIVLVHPEIPANTGNVIRLSANFGFTLHLVEPLGFSLSDKHLRRAGLDYHDRAQVQVHPNWRAACSTWDDRQPFLVTKEGHRRFDRVAYRPGDVLVFGRESVGLPAELRKSQPIEQQIYIPMRENNRSLNLSNSVAIISAEIWRQQGFVGAKFRE